jgi:hypothetical protein
MKIDLNKFRNNIFQNIGFKPSPCYGEDGVFEEIFKQVGVSSKRICVEFGELRSLGTTSRYFKIKFGAKSLYFSSSLDLKSRILNIIDIVLLFVKSKKISALKFMFNLPIKDRALPSNISQKIQRFSKGKEIDLIVVDIDSFDFEIVSEILESKIYPRVFVVEYNPSLPPNVPIYFPFTAKKTELTNAKIYGASYSAWDKLFSNHEFGLVHISGFCNLIYVRKEFQEIFTKPLIGLEITDTYEKVINFAENFCLPGFVPSWLSSPKLNNSDIELFKEYK